MTHRPDADVIIAGAGMAGVTLGLALNSAGLKVILVDPQSFETQTEPAFDGRASAISFAAFRQWRALGAAPYLEPHAQRIEQILVTDARSPGRGAGPAMPAFLRFDAAEIADRTDGEALGYMLENRHIRSGLAQAATAAGLEVLAPERVAKVAVEPGRVRISLEGGRVLSAPLVVGADGRGSLVRREAGIGTMGWGYGHTAVIATVEAEHDHHGVAYEHFLPSGPFAILPLPGRRASLVWTENPRHAAALKTAHQELFDAYLRRRFGDFLGRVEATGPRFTYPLTLQLADRVTAPRIALLGDAAHGIHPIAGQGLNMGLKDVAALAQVLADAMRLGEDIGSEVVLERFARWRSVDNIGVTLATDVFTRLFSNDQPILRLLRGTGMALVNGIGPARRFFMGEAGGALGDLPRLLRGEAL